MVLTSLHSWRAGLSRPLLIAGLLLAGLGVLQLADAAQLSKDKAPAAPLKAPAGPTSLKLTIVSEGADVAEMAKLINEKVEAGWKANKLTPSFYADDHEFIRRASLDIIGRIARPDEIRKYLKDPPEKRRSMLIERLLSSEDYPRHWANLWTNWLLTRAGDFGRGKYHDQTTLWLEDQFASNKGYHEIVTKLITPRARTPRTARSISSSPTSASATPRTSSGPRASSR